MPEYATSSRGDGSRKKPIFDHAGEVTRKKAAATPEDETGCPPAFTGKKIGGATNFVDTPADVTVVKPGSKPQPTAILSIPGVAAVLPQPNAKAVSPEEFVLTQPGLWHSFWTEEEDLAKENSALHHALFSRFCKHCLHDHKACGEWYIGSITWLPLFRRPRFEWTCDECASKGHRCIRLVSFATSSDIALDEVVEPRLRKLAQAYIASIGTEMEVRTTTTDRFKVPRLPLLPGWWKDELEKPREARDSMSSSVSERHGTPMPHYGPTYSRLCDAYEELTETYYHEAAYGLQYQSDREPTTEHDRPFWEEHDQWPFSSPRRSDMVRSINASLNDIIGDEWASDYHHGPQAAHRQLPLDTLPPQLHTVTLPLRARAEEADDIEETIDHDSKKGQGALVQMFKEGECKNASVEPGSSLEEDFGSSDPDIETSSSVNDESDEAFPGWRQRVAIRRAAQQSDRTSQADVSGCSMSTEETRKKLHGLMSIACQSSPGGDDSMVPPLPRP